MKRKEQQCDDPLHTTSSEGWKDEVLEQLNQRIGPNGNGTLIIWITLKSNGIMQTRVCSR